MEKSNENVLLDNSHVPNKNYFVVEEDRCSAIVNNREIWGLLDKGAILEDMDMRSVWKNLD